MLFPEKCYNDVPLFFMREVKAIEENIAAVSGASNASHTDFYPSINRIAVRINVQPKQVFLHGMSEQ